MDELLPGSPKPWLVFVPFGHQLRCWCLIGCSYWRCNYQRRLRLPAQLQMCSRGGWECSKQRIDTWSQVGILIDCQVYHHSEISESCCRSWVSRLNSLTAVWSDVSVVVIVNSVVILTARASGLTPFSINEMQTDNWLRSIPVFYLILSTEVSMARWVDLPAGLIFLPRYRQFLLPFRASFLLACLR